MHPNSSCVERFAEIYGHPAVLVSRAPGRVNLIGEHVDYQNGLVMPVALDRYLEVAAAPTDKPEIRLWSSRIDRDPLCVAVDELRPQRGADSWANYVLGVVAQYLGDGTGVTGFDAVIDGDLPLGAGLSSSAALESASALAIEHLSGTKRSTRERARLCQAAEHQFAGVPCGFMDQVVVNEGIVGHALMIDFESVSTTPLPMPKDLSLVIVNSGVKHALADGEYAKRRADCESATQILGIATLREGTMALINAFRDQLGDRLYRRAHHVISENARVEQFADALRRGDYPQFTKLMADSHASLRDDYEVSCDELDTLVALASDLGAVGTRMTGGGFGGSTINLVPDNQAAGFCKELSTAYADEYDTKVDAFIVNPVDGARCVDLSRASSSQFRSAH
jgi:galactokinase